MVAAVIRDSNPDITGIDDELAKAPYIRESRCIRTELTVMKMHIGQEAGGLIRPLVFPIASVSAATGLTFIRVWVRTTSSLPF